MNRSFHAFAVLLVSLAGGMIAATWTANLPGRRHSQDTTDQSSSKPVSLYCSCNPDSSARFEQGCARDKTTGERYGCGLGLGKNGANDPSVLGRTVISGTILIPRGAVALRDAVAGIPWQKLAAQSKQLETELAVIQARLPLAEAQTETTSDRTHEQEYAAAELAAAGFDMNKPDSNWLRLHERLAPLYRSLSADSVSRFTRSAVVWLGGVCRQWDRQSRLWLVENGLHQQWDAIEEAVMAEDRLASARVQIEAEDFNRWFENFPPPVTQPNRLFYPIEPKDDSEESRRIILATAKALETLSSLLHQTAENLTRQAEQDVAELHKLKSGIEGRR